MFDLEKAIATWRGTLVYNRMFSAEDIEELECHLRDYVEALVASGQSEEAAFRTAVHRLGDYGSIETEYRKVFWVKAKQKSRVWSELLWEISMLLNYLKIAWRNLRRHKGYASINVSGLAIGMAACMLILLYVQDELSYDTFHERADRIYRLVTDGQNRGETTHWAYSWSGWGPLLDEEYPEVLRSVRISGKVGDEEDLVQYGDKVFGERDVYHADSTVFEVFTLPLVQGTPETALRAAYSVIISTEIARKYFGEADPLDKLLTINGEEYMVTGVFQALPANSHIDLDLLISFTTMDQDPDFATFGSFWMYTYLLLRDEGSAAVLTDKFPDFVEQHATEVNAWSTLSLQPLTDIHLHSHRQGEIAPGGDATTLSVFSIIALLVLAIACINFMNLATARSANRAREVGMRKVLGAQRGQIIGQFLGEAMLLSFVAVVLAVLVVWLVTPVFNDLAGKALALDVTDNPLVLIGLVLIALGVGVSSGSYPAFFLSAFQPLAVLQGKAQSRLNDRVLRRVLVVLQFVVSITLIIGTGFIYEQLHFIRTKKLGFDKEQVITLSIEGTSLGRDYEAFRGRLLENPRIQGVAASSNKMGERVWIWNFRPEGWQEEQEDWVTQALLVDYDFIETYGIDLVEGRNFSRAFGADMGGALLINEKASNTLGWTAPVGKHMALPNINQEEERLVGTVVGVVKDFHFASLHQEVGPLAIMLSPSFRRHIVVRVSPVDLATTLAFLEGVWRQFELERPPAYAFVDEDFAQSYRAEERLGDVLWIFSLLAILVACLGLFGLASFTTEQRTKEIGIRKVLGASVADIVLLLSKEFFRLVLVAFVLAIPLAYFAVDRWLESFAYRIEISWPMFVIAGLGALGIALVTVSYQAVKAARADPVEALQYE